MLNMKSERKSHEEFIKKVSQSNTYYNKGEFKIISKYQSANLPIFCRNKYGECKVVAGSLYKGYNLSIKTAIDKTSYFINQAKEIHGEGYDYSKTNYIDSKTKVTIVCKIHGDFDIQPSSHLQGVKCAYCKRRGKGTTQHFIESAIKIHGYSYSYSDVNYQSAKSKVVIICNKHGKFKQTPDNHLKGKGCRKCASFGFDFDKKAILYLIKYQNTYKLGITNRTIKQRYRKKYNQLEVIGIWKFNSGKEAYILEQNIINKAKRFKITDVNTLTNTKSKELFNTNIINIIERYVSQ